MSNNWDKFTDWLSGSFSAAGGNQLYNDGLNEAHYLSKDGTCADLGLKTGVADVQSFWDGLDGGVTTKIKSYQDMKDAITGQNAGNGCIEINDTLPSTEKMMNIDFIANQVRDEYGAKVAAEITANAGEIAEKNKPQAKAAAPAPGR
jgi:hypothetical protein